MNKKFVINASSKLEPGVRAISTKQYIKNSVDLFDMFKVENSLFEDSYLSPIATNLLMALVSELGSSLFSGLIPISHEGGVVTYQVNRDEFPQFLDSIDVLLANLRLLETA